MLVYYKIELLKVQLLKYIKTLKNNYLITSVNTEKLAGKKNVYIETASYSRTALKFKPNSRPC